MVHNPAQVFCEIRELKTVFMKAHHGYNSYILSP